MDARGKALVAWPKCLIPTKKGVLGIKNLKLQNEALLLKHLDKFYNQKDIPWVKLIWHAYYSEGQIPHETPNKASFWWRDIMTYTDHYRGIATCRVGDGKTVMLWNDLWNGHLLKDEFPRLYSFAKNVKISVADYVGNQSIHDQFHLPLSQEAFQELQSLNTITQGLQTVIAQQQKDQWHYIWGTSIYSTAKFYSIPFIALRPPDPFGWIWKSKCTKKVKIFIWLMFLDRLNTRNILRRKNCPIQGGSYNCILCESNVEETAFHLFFECQFSVACWSILHINWQTTLEFFQMIEDAKEKFNKPFFMEVFIMASWHIWKQRNGLIFDQQISTEHTWWRAFKDEVTLQVHRTNNNLRDNLLSWLDSVAPEV
ncbi:hypothetical protein EJB05_47309, partial [Eragrostis curvula]